MYRYRNSVHSSRPFSASLLMAVLGCAAGLAQQTAQDPVKPSNQDVTAPASPDAPVSVDKRIFGVLPNYRTADGSLPFHPLTSKQKMTIAVKDSFDYPVYVLSGVFAGLAQLNNTDPSFGQGIKGFAKRYGASYGDQLIGNMLTEGIMPSLLHEDPRYFRRGTGPAGSRLKYALTRIFVTRTDSGGSRFNCSEVCGNAMATAISNAYHPDGRNVGDNIQHWGTQLGTDMISNVLKEFWPDIKRKIHNRSHDAD